MWHIKKKLYQQRGTSILEITIGLTIYITLMILCCNILLYKQDELEAKNIALEFNQVTRAATNYALSEYHNVYDANKKEGEQTHKILLEDLIQKNYLPQNFPLQNAYQQNYKIYFSTVSEADNTIESTRRLEMCIATKYGKPFPRKIKMYINKYINYFSNMLGDIKQTTGMKKPLKNIFASGIQDSYHLLTHYILEINYSQDHLFRESYLNKLYLNQMNTDLRLKQYTINSLGTWGKDYKISNVGVQYNNNELKQKLLKNINNIDANIDKKISSSSKLYNNWLNIPILYVPAEMDKPIADEICRCQYDKNDHINLHIGRMFGIANKGNTNFYICIPLGKNDTTARLLFYDKNTYNDSLEYIARIAYKPKINIKQKYSNQANKYKYYLKFLIEFYKRLSLFDAVLTNDGYIPIQRCVEKDDILDKKIGTWLNELSNKEFNNINIKKSLFKNIVPIQIYHKFEKTISQRIKAFFEKHIIYIKNIFKYNETQTYGMLFNNIINYIIKEKLIKIDNKDNFNEDIQNYIYNNTESFKELIFIKYDKFDRKKISEQAKSMAKKLRESCTNFITSYYYYYAVPKDSKEITKSNDYTEKKIFLKEILEISNNTYTKYNYNNLIKEFFLQMVYEHLYTYFIGYFMHDKNQEEYREYLEIMNPSMVINQEHGTSQMSKNPEMEQIEFIENNIKVAMNQLFEYIREFDNKKSDKYIILNFNQEYGLLNPTKENEKKIIDLIQKIKNRDPISVPTYDMSVSFLLEKLNKDMNNFIEITAQPTIRFDLKINNTEINNDIAPNKMLINIADKIYNSLDTKHKKYNEKYEMVFGKLKIKQQNLIICQLLEELNQMDFPISNNLLKNICDSSKEYTYEKLLLEVIDDNPTIIPHYMMDKIKSILELKYPKDDC